MRGKKPLTARMVKSLRKLVEGNELHELLTGKPVDNTNWPSPTPEFNAPLIELEEDLIRALLSDIHEVKNVINRSSQDSVRLANNKIAFEGPFDVAVLFTNSQNSAIEANRAGIPHIVGYSNQSRDKFIDHKIIQENPSEDPEHYLKIARAVGSKIT